MPNRSPVKSEASAALTSRDAAEILGVSVTTAQNWLESGVLPSWKTPGGHRRVLRADVLKLLASYAAERQGGTGAADACGYPKAGNDLARIRALKKSGLMDTHDPAFDRITALARDIIDVPIALITMLDGEQQWFKSRAGTELRHTERELAFCNHTIMRDEVFVVEDARRDARFASNALVLAAPHIRFYAGVPVGDDDVTYGALCVLDHEPRMLRNHERGALINLGQMTCDLIRLRRLQKLQCSDPDGIR